MADENSGTVRSVAWSEIFPWLVIFRSFRLAIDPRALPMAAAGLLLMIIGWWVCGQLFIENPSATWVGPILASPWEAATDRVVQDTPAWPKIGNLTGVESWPSAPRPLDPLFGTWADLSQPLWNAFYLAQTVPGLAMLALSGLWALAVWSLFGGAISRIVAVQVASDERVGWVAALRYAVSKWRAYFAAPLFPVLGIVLVAIPLAIAGLLLRADFGLLIVGVLAWPFLLVGGLIMGMLLLGLVFGWPLMWGTISAEGTDSFDALSRSYAYVFQRPLRYLFYAVVAALFGLLGWLLVSNFAAAVVGLTYWAASWGSSSPRMAEIMAGGDLSGIGRTGAVMIDFWSGCVKLLAASYLYSYFWTATTIIYFLLRRDVDATEMDEVFLDADESEQTHPLPPIKTDEAGAPVAGEEVPGDKPENTAE